MALTKAQKKLKEKHIKYWKDREEEADKRRIVEEKAYERELQKIYENMLESVQKEIDSFYMKYAKSEGLTLAEAKKAISKHDVKAFERKAARYVKERNFSKEANEELRLYNATMRINRLEMLKANIGLEMIAGHDELQKYMEGILQGRTMEELERQAGILGKTIRNNAQMANAIVNASFNNAKFSDRIWQYQDIMKADLSKLLQSGLIAGKNPRVLAKDIKKYFIGEPELKNGKKGAVFNAERLMRTELARVQTEAQRQSFEMNGFTQYIFLALGDACDICKDIDENHYNVKDMMPGLNAPPMHPHCRCSTAAYEDDDEYNAWLEYLNEGGTTEEWNKTGKAKWEASKKAKTEEENEDVVAYKKARAELEEARKQAAIAQEEADELMDKLTDADEDEADKINALFEKRYDEAQELKARAEELEKGMKEKEAKALKGFEEQINARFKFTHPAKLEGMSFEVAEKVAATYEKVFNKYPELIGKLNGFELKKINDINEYGQTVFSKDGVENGRIYLNKMYFGDANGLDALEGRMKDAIAKGHHAAGTETFEGVIAHEIGHAIDAVLSNAGAGIGNRVAQNNVLRSQGIDTKDQKAIKEMLSGYASTKPSEFMAEGFAESVTSPNPRKLAREIEKAYKEYIKKKLQK
jgi:SPP1 gp7 family putative phage head morphogenesis protein